MGRTSPPPYLLPGTLDLLILQAIGRESMHGYGIAQYLKTLSTDVLQVGEGSLYPALQRLMLSEVKCAMSGFGPRHDHILKPDLGYDPNAILVANIDLASLGLRAQVGQTPRACKAGVHTQSEPCHAAGRSVG